MTRPDEVPQREAQGQETPLSVSADIRLPAEDAALSNDKGERVASSVPSDAVRLAVIEIRFRDCGVLDIRDKKAVALICEDVPWLVERVRTLSAGRGDDSARLDWIERERVSITSPGLDIGQPNWCVYAEDGDEITEHPGPVRAAIDAAMQPRRHRNDSEGA